jgi:predicted house-cleaning noncanonical NTP pyrophosphatase (MazG superfamily)
MSLGLHHRLAITKIEPKKILMKVETKATISEVLIDAIMSIEEKTFSYHINENPDHKWELLEALKEKITKIMMGKYTKV